MASKNSEVEELRAELDRLRAEVAALNAQARPQAIKQKADDELWFRTKAVADLEDHAERATKMLTMAPHERKRTLQHMDVPKIIATLDALSPKECLGFVPSDMHALLLEIKVARTPAPEMVRCTLADLRGELHTPTIEPPDGRSKKHPGVHLVGRYFSGEGDCAKVLELGAYKKLCKKDAAFAEAIGTGVVLVESLTETEVRTYLRVQESQKAESVGP